MKYCSLGTKIKLGCKNINTPDTCDFSYLRHDILNGSTGTTSIFINVGRRCTQLYLVPGRKCKCKLTKKYLSITWFELVFQVYIYKLYVPHVHSCEAS